MAPEHERLFSWNRRRLFLTLSGVRLVARRGGGTLVEFENPDGLLPAYLSQLPAAKESDLSHARPNPTTAPHQF
jgi:hypothetical protein